MHQVNTPPSAPKYSWLQILVYWNRAAVELGRVHELREPPFVDVDAPDPTGWYAREKLECWPRDSVEERRAFLATHVLPFWSTPASTQVTASMLWHARGRADAVAAVLLSAWLNDCIASEHPWMRSERVRHLLNAVAEPTAEGLRAAGFNPASWRDCGPGAIPVSAWNRRYSTLVEPIDAESLVSLATLDASQTMAQWQFVRVRRTR